MPNFYLDMPTGLNDSITGAISSDGSPELNKHYTLPARTGVAVRLEAGQSLIVVNPTGTQVCDFWAFNPSNLYEYLSMSHCRTALASLVPTVGDILVSNARRSMLTLVRDTSSGVHDTVIAACDHARYQQLGCKEYHDNCTDNLRQALKSIGLEAKVIPDPFNLWMNVPITSARRTEWAAPVSRPDDEIEFRAEVDVLVVMSACPQDVTPVNGENCAPSDLAYRVTLWGNA
ncbi:hypothetical protein PsAD46_03433 [Pseudovibrio sp. Ad46]|uniref:DUF1989 domain-containing protein n=1 Tax=unclassified Pseudovibrio TaxID=2627060 RepID=UPI0007B1B6A4|nr:MULTISPECIES: urea carboxylase-associated family protein [unclassified Pseudovibrio]KZK84462.1 hypothetical protein PsAD46_03433 [Pseudovibrio sp. Ad46]KZK96616.1 hypothetical protein PsAD5_02816 [Pseudovibrio sp. Ad5]